VFAACRSDIVLPKGILEKVLMGVGHLALQVDFMMIETGGDDRAPIILG
jgi:hypothetical protein